MMKPFSKITLISTGLLSMAALSACQTTPQTAQEMKQGHYHQKQHKERLSPEQRAQMKQERIERKQIVQQIRQACDNKTVGQTVQIQTTQQMIDGSCQIRFKLDREELKKNRLEARQQHKDQFKNREKLNSQRFHRGENLTDARRAELVKQYDQRLAQRQARQQAFASACQGQTDGKKVKVKMGEQMLNGQCQVYFKPNQQASKIETNKSV